MDAAREGKRISLGVCPHGHALLMVGQERVMLSSDQLRTLVRLGMEALICMDEVDPRPASPPSDFH